MVEIDLNGKKRVLTGTAEKIFRVVMSITAFSIVMVAAWSLLNYPIATIILGAAMFILAELSGSKLKIGL